MEEAVVRSRAVEHGQALVAGDLERAGRDISPEGMARMGAIVAALPAPLSSVEVLDVRAAADDWISRLRYAGPGRSTTVDLLWADQDGRLVIVDAGLIPAAA